VKRPANVRFVVTLGPSSQTATRMPVPSNPARCARSERATAIEFARSISTLVSSNRITPTFLLSARLRICLTVAVARA
jgi:hypothetical protein